MVLFKINGERNSGTNFIANILEKNNLPVYVQGKTKYDTPKENDTNTESQ